MRLNPKWIDTGVGGSAVARRLWLMEPQSGLAPFLLGHAPWLILASIVLILLIPETYQVTTLQTEGLWGLFVAYFLYALILEVSKHAYPTWYQKQWFRACRVLVSIITVSCLLFFSGGQHSYFWFLYLFPILQTIFYFQRTYIWSVALVVILNYLLISWQVSVHNLEQPHVPKLFMISLFLGFSTFLFNFLYHSANNNAASLLAEQALRQQQLELLNKLSFTIVAAPSLQEALQAALQEGMRAIGVQEASIMIVDPANQDAEFEAWLVDGQFLPSKVHGKKSAAGGIARQVIESGKPYFYNETIRDAFFIPSESGRPIGSLLSVPIIANERVIGVINCDAQQPGRFNETELSFIEVLASHVAIAVETHRLRDLGLQLATLDPETLAERIVDNAATLTGAENSTLFLLDESEQHLLRVKNFPPERQTSAPPRPNGLSQWILNNGQPLAIADVRQDERIKQSTLDEGVHSILGVPLKVPITGGHDEAPRYSGVLWVNTKQRRNWSDRDIKLMGSLAGHAAAAFSNARLFRQTERHSQELAQLNQIALALTRYQPWSTLLKSILDKAVALLQAQGGGLYLLNETGDEMKLAAVSGLPEALTQMSIPVSRSVSGRVVQSREPFTITNYSEWGDRLDMYDGYNFSAVAGAPIIWHGPDEEKVLGALTVRDVAPGREFSPAEIDLLLHLARLAAIGLENIRQRDELTQLFDNAAHGITVVNSEGTVVKCNPQAAALYGLEQKTVIGRPVITLYEDEAQAHLVQARLTRSPQRPLTDFDTNIRSASGEIIPIRLSASLLTDYMGNLCGSVGFFRDRRDIESIRQHTQQLTSLLEAIQMLTEELDLDQLLTTIVQAARQVLSADAASVYLYDAHADQIATEPVQEGLLFAAEASEEVGEGSPVRGVLRSGEMHFVDNVAQHPFLAGDFVQREKIVSLATAPLKYEGTPVCIFFCNYREPHQFSDEEQNVFKLFATAAAVAIGKMRLYNASQHKAWALEQLNQMALRTTRTYQLPTLLQELLETAVALMAGQGGALYILEAHDHYARPAALLNMAPIRIPAADNLVGQVCQTRQAKLVKNYYKWPVRLQELDAYTLGDVAAVPIAYRDRTWGALVVHTKKEERGLQQEEMPYLELLGQLAAVALENNRLQPLQRVNVALALLSRWGHSARNKIFALGQDVKALRKELPVGIQEYDDILENMATSLADLSYPAQTLLRESEQVLQQGRMAIDLGQLVVAIAKRVCAQSKIEIVLEQEGIDQAGLLFAGSQLLVETACELLVENARSAIEQAGNQGQITIKGAYDANWIMLTIQDTGRGLPAEIREYFFQQPVTSDTGFGYGAYVAASILRAQGGDIFLTHTGPAGTCIELRLPRFWPDNRKEVIHE